MNRVVVRLGAVLAALGIAVGAFGAHGLSEAVPPDALDTFETGARYHMYAALALIGLGAAGLRTRTAVILTVGAIIFAGSLYLLTLTGISWLGAITPIGGVLMIVALLMSVFELRGPRA